MSANGRVLDPKLRRDRAVIQAACHQVEHLTLSGGQPPDAFTGRHDAVGAPYVRSLTDAVRCRLPDYSVDQDRPGAIATKRGDRREEGSLALRVRAMLDFEIRHFPLEDCDDRVHD